MSDTSDGKNTHTRSHAHTLTRAHAHTPMEPHKLDPNRKRNEWPCDEKDVASGMPIEVYSE